MFRCEGVFNKNGICLGVRVRVSVVFVSLCVCQFVCLCVHTGVGEWCVSVSCVSSPLGDSSSVPQS